MTTPDIPRPESASGAPALEPSTAPQPAHPSLGTVAAIVYLFGFVSACSSVVTRVNYESARAQLFLCAIMATLLVIIKFVLGRIARQNQRSSLPVAIPVAALTAAAILFWVINDWLTWKIMCLGGRLPLSTLTEDITGLYLLALLGPVVAACAIAVLLVLARFWEKAMARIAGFSAIAATVLLAIFVVVGGVRAVARPGFFRYVEGLENAGSIASPGIAVPSISGKHRIPGPPKEHRKTIGDLTVIQSCVAEGCRVALMNGPDATTALGEIAAAAPHQSWSDDLEMLRDRREGVVYLRSEQYCPAIREFRYVGDGWKPSFFYSPAIAARTSAPWHWLAGGAAGLVIALLGWSARHRALRRRRELQSAISGVLSADGWVTLDDGRTMRVEPPNRTPSGPVLVLGGTPSRRAYRDNAPLAASDIVTGTRAENADTLELEVRWQAAIMLSVACLAAAPLVAAAIEGLIF